VMCGAGQWRRTSLIEYSDPWRLAQTLPSYLGPCNDSPEIRQA
jgi:hypothetical protein